VRYRILPFTLCLLASCAVAPNAQAEPAGLVYLGDLAGGTTSSTARGISGDGTIIVGDSISANGTEAFRWTSGTGMVGIGDIPGGTFSSQAVGVSDDGSAISGYGWGPSGYTSFLWTSGGGMVDLGDLPGGLTHSFAFDMSSDGTVVIGYGVSALGTEAYRWTSGTGLVALGDLPGASYVSLAQGVSGDGQTVVGLSISASGSEAFRWTSGTGMVGLGDLPGGVFSSVANKASDDGSVIVGYGTSADGNEAFRWTSGTGMVGLGDLPGGGFNSRAINLSADGSVVVGYGTSDSGAEAFIWDQAHGMRELDAVLTDLGVDLTGWTLLASANDVSDNGEKITGYGTYLGNTAAFLAVVSNSLIPAITTVDGLVESLSEAQVSHQQAISQNGIYSSRGLFLARNALSYFPKVVIPQQKIQSLSLPSLIEPAAGDDGETYLSYNQGYFSPEKWAFYTLGSFAMGQENNADSHSLDGSAGVLYRADQNWIVGGGMISGQSHIDLRNGGENILDSYGGEILFSYQNPNGLRLYMVGFASYLTLDSSRGYMNGGGRDYSYGESEGYGYGASARLGYEMDVIPERGMTVTPYIETEYSKTKLDSYDEKHGPFPASYTEQSGERVIGRAGVELSHDIGEHVTLRGRVAYAERLHEDDESVTASSTGLAMSLSPNKLDDRWGEGGVSVLWKAGDDLSFSADISGRTGKTEDPYARATIGMTLGF
jgi:probable HAF family extracellular repeat protein